MSLDIETAAILSNLSRRMERIETYDSDYRVFRYDGWSQTNVTANQSAVQLNRWGQGAPLNSMRAGFSGSLLEVWVRSNEARTAGTLQVEVYIGGVASGLIAQLDATNTTYHNSSQAINTDTHTASEAIVLRITTDASWTPTTADIVCGIALVQD